MRMTMSDYIDSIKLQLFAGILEPELDDATLEKLINLSLVEMNRYYSVTDILTLPASSCISLVEHPEVDLVVNVFRTTALGTTENAGSSMSDPMYISQMAMYNLGTSYYNNNWIYNFSNYNQLQRIQNTLSTDLQFRQDKKSNLLYINYSQGVPAYVSIEYVPRLTDVSEVQGEYREDILMRLSLAHVKIALGRVRTRYTQDGAIWRGDGDTILAEGQNELTALRDRLRDHADMVLPID